MRPEQEAAVNRTYNYFKNKRKEKTKEDLKFLWNAKMRFGKTFATYQLAKSMQWKRVLVLTFKPAVQNAWKDDLNLHIDFKDWTFFDAKEDDIKILNKKKNFVCFASFQDFLGKTKSGGIKLKNQWAHEINWDCIVFDEYHFGAWRDRPKIIHGEEKRNKIVNW